MGNTKEIVIEKTTVENFVMEIKKYLRKLDRKKRKGRKFHLHLNFQLLVLWENVEGLIEFCGLPWTTTCLGWISCAS